MTLDYLRAYNTVIQNFKEQASELQLQKTQIGQIRKREVERRCQIEYLVHKCCSLSDRYRSDALEFHIVDNLSKESRIDSISISCCVYLMEHYDEPELVIISSIYPSLYLSKGHSHTYSLDIESKFVCISCIISRRIVSTHIVSIVPSNLIYLCVMLAVWIYKGSHRSKTRSKESIARFNYFIEDTRQRESSEICMCECMACDLMSGGLQGKCFRCIHINMISRCIIICIMHFICYGTKGSFYMITIKYRNGTSKLRCPPIIE